MLGLLKAPSPSPFNLRWFWTDPATAIGYTESANFSNNRETNMTNKTDKEIAAEILIAALSTNADARGLQYQRDDVANAQIELIAKAFTHIYQAVKDCDKTE